MAHKVHPKVFRLRKAGDWMSRWMTKGRPAGFLKGDFLIRDYIEKRLHDMGVASVEIERFAGKLNVIINSSRPGLIIGRGGSGVEEMRKDLMNILRTKAGHELAQGELRLEIREIKNPWTSSALSGQWIAQQLEHRKPFRMTLRQTMNKIMANKEILGARIDIAGRLGGADIARRETTRKGRLPLQTLRSDIDYALTEAKTTYGTIGVKVWMYKGEKFES
ncbi:MAG: 30S ribosomal protein S3 [bacterium]|nr:30S ribosomal protein S3 [bacterium]MDZ4231842.1 30S ribosomal protein S3 [Candidatus Pacearchaeota archaeon]